jgi:mannitol-1-phosphate 5-dehydrogenase
MSRQAVIFGAGNIGRGFIGQLLSESGFTVTFVDVDDELVQALNTRREYHLQTVFYDEIRDYRIGPVRAIHGRDLEAVAKAVAAADLAATAVGANALPYVAPGLAAGIAARAQANGAPLNIILCENLKGAAKIMRGYVTEKVAPEAAGYLAESVGFVDTVIGRMVPMPTPEMRAEDVSFIRVEPYKELPVDRAGFVGPIPEVVAMEAHDNFALYTARKLYVHNCGHALLAYTGHPRGYEYGYEAMRDPEVRKVMDGGLRESVAGIAAKYGADPAWLQANMDDLMARFGNHVLADTVFRLGRDPIRKLSPTDRLVGAAKLVEETVGTPRFLSWGIAEALNFADDADPVAVDLQARLAVEGPAKVLQEICAIDPHSVLGQQVLHDYELLRENPTRPFEDIP